jgi:hypothetical protein
MNKKKEEQEHMTIHAFDQQGRTVWHRLTDFARRNGEPLEVMASPMSDENPSMTQQETPERRRSVFGLWNSGSAPTSPSGPS